MNANELLNRYDNLIRKIVILKIKRKEYFSRCFSSEIQTTPEDMDALLKQVNMQISKLELLAKQLYEQIINLKLVPMHSLVEHEIAVTKEEKEKLKLQHNNDNITVIPSNEEGINGITQSETQGIYLSKKIQDVEKTLSERQKLIDNLTERYIRENISSSDALTMMKEIDEVYGIMHNHTMNEDLLDMLNELNFGIQK